MAFSFVYASGELQCQSNYLENNDLAESVALQFPESLQVVCPACDLAFITRVHPKVFCALSSEFTVSETLFESAVATKWTITNWSVNRPHMCRFDIHHKVTVTFGVYPTLYSLENDLACLTETPRYSQHFMCLVIPRSLNWQTMVQLCTQLLQIQYPTYPVMNCKMQQDIVLVGWQRGSSVKHSDLMQVYDSLLLHTPMSFAPCHNKITEFNSAPVYCLRYIMKSKPRVQPKQRRVFTTTKVAQALVPIIPVPAQVPAQVPQKLEEKQHDMPLKNEEEDWVITVIYGDDESKF